MGDILLLLITLSIDTFLAAFINRVNHITIPYKSKMTMILLCSSIVTLSLILGNFFLSTLPTKQLQMFRTIILATMGIEKLSESIIKNFLKKHHRQTKRNISCFHLKIILRIYQNYEKADQDKSKDLSIREAIFLSLALSIDGIFGGFAFGIVKQNAILILLSSILINSIGMGIGIFLGRKMSTVVHLDLSWITGIFFLFLAFT